MNATKYRNLNCKNVIQNWLNRSIRRFRWKLPKVKTFRTKREIENVYFRIHWCSINLILNFKNEFELNWAKRTRETVNNWRQHRRDMVLILISLWWLSSAFKLFVFSKKLNFLGQSKSNDWDKKKKMNKVNLKRKMWRPNAVSSSTLLQCQHK